ncbi:hypothetical protein C1646_764541 [Rhizophagus diaphanus]|nr:hypothetical protein C1646_764541 [Rhizophagus diaphanus] [Rhizophagus sp. MUCL 43196]
MYHRRAKTNQDLSLALDVNRLLQSVCYQIVDDLTNIEVTIQSEADDIELPIVDELTPNLEIRHITRNYGNDLSGQVQFLPDKEILAKVLSSDSLPSEEVSLLAQLQASGSGSTKTQKQTSIPEASEDNEPFRLVVPSSLYLQQSRMIPPICNVTVHRELMSITHTTEPYRSNIYRELMPITHTTKPYKSNVRTAEPYRSNVHTAKPYKRKLTPIIREPYSSNWTRDVNDEMEVDEEEARVIPQLIEVMKSRYTPRYRQVKSWLSALHKHHRVRLLYKQRGTLDKDNYCLHRNNRLNEKKARRTKGAKSLFNKNDEKLENYN